MPSILLRGGTALIHDANDHVKGIRTDILIEDNKIARIEADISPPAGAEVIDCQEKIISPGFVDTHHHLWQTQLKGRHANELLLEYMATGMCQSSNYTLSDFFWGQLGGCLEALDAGTTTVVDHAHLTYSPEAPKIAISATISSGIRSIFCYCPMPRVASWSPFTMQEKMLEPWVLDTMQELGSAAPFGENGRVQLGLAFDSFFLPKEVVLSIFSQAKSLGIKTITSHCVRNAQLSWSSLPSLLDSYGLLDESILLSHASNTTPEDAALIRKTNAHVSSTPSTELQMAHGTPVCFQESLKEMQPQCSLGIDCHSNNSSSIPGEMRLALQSARDEYNQKFILKGKAPRKVKNTVEEAFNFGTILGARAIGMEGQIGSIEPGKLADLTIFDALSPSMVCAAEHDPVAAIVLHSQPGDIHIVIVDGKIRKCDGSLVPIQVNAGAKRVAGKTELDWNDVAKELLRSRKSLQKKIDELDFDHVRQAIIRNFHINEADIVDKV